jgi:hypothetical protein
MHHEAEVVLPALLHALAVEQPILIGHSDGAVHRADPRRHVPQNRERIR